MGTLPVEALDIQPGETRCYTLTECTEGTMADGKVDVEMIERAFWSASESDREAALVVLRDGRAALLDGAVEVEVVLRDTLDRTKARVILTDDPNADIDAGRYLLVRG
jgi:hypothetical protein